MSGLLGGAPPPSPNALANILFSPGLQPVERLWYSQQRITLDGYHFKRCRFDDCVLVAQTANFKLEDCLIAPSTKVEIGASLLKVVQLYNIHQGALGLSLTPAAFLPKRNADGTVSVGL